MKRIQTPVSRSRLGRRDRLSLSTAINRLICSPNPFDQAAGKAASQTLNKIPLDVDDPDWNVIFPDEAYRGPQPSEEEAQRWFQRGRA